jgi:hypothetical protein
VSRRDATPYSQRREWSAPEGYGQPVDQLREGYFRHKLRGGGVYVGIQIAYGPPADPVTGEPLDRSWRWQAFVNGKLVEDLDQVWPACAGDPITFEEYQTYCARQRWAEQHAPDSAYANPRKKIDPLSGRDPMLF